MIVKEITRSYSRSFNTKTYGAPESWIKIESAYTAQLESGDDVAQVSSSLHEQAKKEVIDAMKVITDRIQGSSATPTATTPTAPVTPRPL